MRYYISACADAREGGGVYIYSLSDAGKLMPISSLPCALPMYTAREGDVLYTILKGNAGEESTLITSHVVRDIPKDTTPPAPTGGQVACHLTVKDGDVYIANYVSGSLTKLGGPTVTFARKGPHPQRQTAAHTHQVILSPDEKYVLVTDLGGDTITVLDRVLTMPPICEAAVPAGNGCRHMVFSPDGNTLYCVNELSATVSIFSWKNGMLSYLREVSSEVPADLIPTNTAAAIRISKDGSRLYISNRGEDSLIMFTIKDGTQLTLAQKVSCGGAGPRDFLLTADEKHLICTNERSDSVCVFALQDGRIGQMTDRIFLPGPLCVMEWGEKIDQ